MASKINIQPHHLSQVINQSFGKNFSDFINSYRVEEAKTLIMENENAKMEAIAFDSGFNTKTTFYSAFKKMTGTTPTEFKKNAIKTSQEL